MMGLQPTGPTRVNLEVIVPSPKGLTPEMYFFRPTPCGFRQVVQQLSKPVAIKINYLIRTGADAVVAAKVNWKRTDT